MSHDGSSAKSYIRHATEKERLDNLAFASFPEDYLPYAATQGHNRAAPPPYLLWGEDRRRRPAKRRRSPKCAGALLCAIILVVIAILAVVAISVYLGVVTNLFRSPVISVSGRFIASEQFSEELLNSTSSQFLEKADIYQSKVEKAFLSSSLEPAFIAARIYSFRPGLVVFFRVYLDRRKLNDDGDTTAKELVRDLITLKLTQDPSSVLVEENEDLLSGDTRSNGKILPPKQLKTTTSTPSSDKPNPLSAGGVGQWRPVPIEDSVLPSFGDGPQQGVLGSVRSPEGFPRNPLNSGSVRALDEGISQGSQPKPSNPQTPENSQRNPSTTLNSQRNPPISEIPEEGVGFVRLAGSKNPLLAATRPEGTGSIRLQQETPAKIPKLVAIPSDGVGTVRLLDDASILPETEGTRIHEKLPKSNNQPVSNSGSGMGSVRVLEENPTKKLPTRKYSLDGLRAVEQPPTLAPSVSLIVRNRSRSDRPQARLDEAQENGNLEEAENVGVGSIREILTEVDSFHLPPLAESERIRSKLLDLDSDEMKKSKSADDIILKNNNTTKKINHHKQEDESSSATTLSALNDLVHADEANDLNLNGQNLESEQKSSTDINISEAKITTLSDILTSNIATVSEKPVSNKLTKQRHEESIKTTPLEEILFNPAQNPLITTVTVNTEVMATEEKSVETSLNSEDTDEKTHETPPSEATETTSKNSVDEFHTEDTGATGKEDLEEEDIHLRIVNHSPYPNAEFQYHTIENNISNSSIDSFNDHTSIGHGFHKPSSTSQPDTATTSKSVSTIEIEFSPENLSSLSENISFNFSTEKSSLELFTEIPGTQATKNSDETDKNDHLVTTAYTNTPKNISITSEEVWSEINDGVNITTEDNSQQAKVVPQLQSHLLSNDIENGEETDDNRLLEDHFPEEILRHITTITPQQNGTDDQLCPFGMVPCSASGVGCGVRCDMKRDCVNNEDEHGCRCSDLLRAMGQSQKMCDGIDDCSDGSDEADCSWCPSADDFKCPLSRTCIKMEQVCDGKEDCPGGQDEKRCVSLAESSTEAKSPEYRPEGFLLLRRNGQWGKLCLDSLIHSPDLDRRTKELGRAVCTALTYKNMTSSVRTKDRSEPEDSYYQISAETANNRSVSSLFVPSTCKGKQVLSVQCQTLECGLRPSAPPTQRRRIVGGKSAEGAGAWPWAAALYREGDFQCGGALISDYWLVSAAHCFFSSQGAHWVARLGVLRRGSELQSGWEHVRRIQDIILHPDYEDVGFINDIALLKMDKPVPFSDSLRPICLPHSALEDASLWHGRRCSVIGWGKLYEIGHTFPDSLQEVFLPVISSAECQRRSIFLPAYRITPKMFCAGYERGGRDACLGDSGGPMACQRPSDSRWVLLGVTSNGDGCGRPNRPGVYTQVASYMSWLQEVTINQKDFQKRTGSESTCSGGIRCRLGRCIQQSRVCDGKRDCAEGEDEENC